MTPSPRTDESIPLPLVHCVEWSRVDCTGDLQRFDDAEAMHRRYRDLVENEPEAIFIVAIEDRRPVSLFRRDGHETLKQLSPERQVRAQYLCAGAQTRHDRRWGDQAIRHQD